MAALKLSEGDLMEKFILGSGSGGQKINKTSSCVYLKHKPTGIELKCQTSRSRDVNRIQARYDLCKRLEDKKSAVANSLKQAREKRKRQTRQRSKRQKARMLDDKSKHSLKKSLRRRPTTD